MMAAATLKPRLRKRSEFTQMTYPGGVNAGGLAKVGGINVRELESRVARS